ncbi:MAG: zinc ribbon domain-containing protein [Desulfomonile sp.]
MKMPIYEYRCKTCGKEFEEWQKFSDPPVDACPECGGQASRLISASTFVLKGTGWYVTDYGRKDSGHAKKASEKSESTSTSEASKADSTVSKDSGSV